MIKLLLDANLSWRLIKLLSDSEFREVIHVHSLPLSKPAKDIDIWNWAKSNEFCIVTNDEDFLNLVLQKGFPPKIILLRTGNQNTKTLSEVLISQKQALLELVESDKIGVLEIF